MCLTFCRNPPRILALSVSCQFSFFFVFLALPICILCRQFGVDRSKGPFSSHRSRLIASVGWSRILQYPLSKISSELYPGEGIRCANPVVRTLSVYIDTDVFFLDIGVIFPYISISSYIYLYIYLRQSLHIHADVSTCLL